MKQMTAVIARKEPEDIRDAPVEKPAITTETGTARCRQEKITPCITPCASSIFSCSPVHMRQYATVREQVHDAFHQETRNANRIASSQ
jgi:hypothetical protein